MAGRDRRHGRSGRAGAFVRWFPVVVVLAILAVAIGAWWADRPEPGPDPQDEPAAVLPPEGVELPGLVPPGPVAQPVDESLVASPAKVRRQVEPFLRDRDLGRRVHVVVAGLASGRAVFSSGADPAMPASTTKLLTTTAALEVLGPEAVFTTSVVRVGNRVTLVGGGDPLLALADVNRLARGTAQALLDEGIRRPRLAYDDSLFTGPDFSPHWPDSYRLDVVSPISALWVDEGRVPVFPGRTADPAGVAARDFSAALARAGVRPQGPPRPGTAAGAEVASVDSEPVAAIVEHIVETSDNEAAEVLLRHVGREVSGAATFAAGSRAVADVLRRLGVATPGLRLYDGSGLSRDNRIDPDTLVDVLRVAASADHPGLRATVTGLPVAGFTGSLAYRFDDATSPGRVRAKTGTLRGVSALAGIATDLDGVPLVFAVVADKVRYLDTLEARDTVDDLAAALGACHCAA